LKHRESWRWGYEVLGSYENGGFKAFSSWGMPQCGFKGSSASERPSETFFGSDMNQLRHMSNPLKVEAVQVVASFNVL